MERRHLRYFTVLADELHFGRAAERLGISPPTLTVQIQQMEDILSARLFTRTKRSVALTMAGEVFLDHAKSVLEGFDQAEVAGRRAGRGEVGRVSLGYVGSAVYGGILQEHVNAFRAKFPDVELSAKEYAMSDLPALVEDGSVDIGFVRLPMALSRALTTLVLKRDHFFLAVPSNHRVAQQEGPVEPRYLSHEHFVVPEQYSGTADVSTRGGFAPNIVSQPGSLVAVVTQVSLGDGIAVVPSMLRDVLLMPNVTFKEIAGKRVPSEVGAIMRSRETSPAAKHFATMLKEVALT